MRTWMVLSLMVLTGCATLLHSATQDVGISSEPTGAQVIVDNKPLGSTPVVATLSRKASHTIRVELAGYQPVEQVITSSPSGWTAMNLVFLPGFAVDALTGGMWQLSADRIHVTLTRVEPGNRAGKPATTATGRKAR